MKEQKKLQNKLLDSYKELKNLFDSNEIDFFALGGTAIGAFRESGFIPWDDDIDLVIKYTDVVKFIDLIKLSKRYTFLGNCKRDGQYVPFLKLYDKSINVKRFNNDEKRSLFIDIFVAYPKIEWSKLKWTKNRINVFFDSMNILNFKERVVAENYSIAIGYEILKKVFFWKFIKRNFKLFKSMHKYIMKKSMKKNEKSIYLYAYHANKIKERFNVSKIVKLKFEDTTMPVTEMFAKDSEWIYGDIYKKPKKNNPQKHGLKIDG